MGSIHIFVSIILSFVVVMQLDLNGKAILWNVLVFNLPVFLDFAHTFNCVPKEKIGKLFKFMLDFTFLGLIISVLLSCIGIGIFLNLNNNMNNILNYFSSFGKFFLRLTILYNPLGVLADYMCSILIEEHRIDTRVEANTRKLFVTQGIHCQSLKMAINV